MRIFFLLPLLIVLGSCSKPEPVDQKDKADQVVRMESSTGTGDSDDGSDSPQSQIIGYWAYNHERTVKYWKLSGLKKRMALEAGWTEEVTEFRFNKFSALMNITSLLHFEKDGKVTQTYEVLTSTGTYTFNPGGESTGQGEMIVEEEQAGWSSRHVNSLSLNKNALTIKTDLSKSKLTSGAGEEERFKESMAHPPFIYTRIEEAEFTSKVKEIKQESVGIKGALEVEVDKESLPSSARKAIE